jgi:hypothetical protein
VTTFLSEHNGIKLDINKNGNFRKYSSTGKLNNSFLNVQWVIEDIREEIKTPRIKLK